MTDPEIARIAVSLSLDRLFDYKVPDRLKGKIEVGSMVSVPFGHGTQTGYVVAKARTSKLAELKEISGVVGDRAMLPRPLIRLGGWMADYYCCAREQGIKAMLPAAVRNRRITPRNKKYVTLNPDADVAAYLEKIGKKAPRQSAVIKRLVRGHSERLRDLVRDVGVTHGSIQSLVKKGIVTIEERRELRDPFADSVILPTSPLDPTSEQATALTVIRKSLDENRSDVILLCGVTGSGKTEVYLQGIQKCFELGKDAIVLVPEIALTPQTTERFRSRFGNAVSILHSHLGDGERFDEWNRIHEGAVKIVIGARSALFAPFLNLGLIVVDEEHETSYKQDIVPRYHARDVAVMRGHMENAVVILGTATPSLETYYNVEKGKYRISILQRRAEERPMPAMEIVDMGAESMRTGRPHILSERLLSQIRERLDNGEQVMLFLNRRGYATQMQCLKCGYVAECPDCTMRFTYHRKMGQLICHLCGNLRRAPDRCPACSDHGIRYSGLGTEKVESAIKGVFPYARVLRMDSDTMTRKDSYRAAWTSVRAGDIDILIGTQMIAKGLDFPNVSLVGMIFADQTLNVPDFRAGERTFQLLVQMAGRCGRGDLPGYVIVQTYTPHHPVLAAAITQDIEAFYRQELASRESLQLPPFTHMALVVIRGLDEQEIVKIANRAYQAMASHLSYVVTLAQPLPAPILKKRGRYYYQILLTTRRIATTSRELKRLIGGLKRPKDIHVYVDIDPYSMT